MKLARVNTILLVAVIVINGYLLLAPFYPKLAYCCLYHSQAPASTAMLKKLVKSRPAPGSPLPDGDWLIVPSMHLEDKIYEGPDLSALKHGPWRRPNTSTPDKGGNTVIVGHRFTYTNPRGTFYSLNKVRVGDQIAVIWEHKKYTYAVNNVKEVTPGSLGVEQPTKNAELTLYTCTPLWLPKDRLVVVAQLLGVAS